MRINRRQFFVQSGAVLGGVALAPLLNAKALLLDQLPTDSQGRKIAEGFVFHDRNGNGRREPSEPGVAGVCVSNGREVVRTDRDGRWRLPVDEDTVLFVIKPSGWRTPVDGDQIPRFYYVHKPNGSPQYRFAGVRATGGLPASVDFPLEPQSEDRRFRIVLFGDPQPRNQTEIDYMAHDVIEQCALDAAAVGARFGISLGDIMFDNLQHYESLNRTVGKVGLPWYNVLGNHDLNFDALDDTTSHETWHRVYGPNYYAFNYGAVHFIVLDDVVWDGAQKNSYHGEITADQLDFVKNDLAFVPKDRLVVVCVHIPLNGVDNRRELFRLLEDRPHTLSLSAHTHNAAHHFFDAEDGWNGKTPHHHIVHATVCGSWWRGAPDERGIPHATMSDGGPNGYSIAEFDGTRYKLTFRAASRPASEQMSVWLPTEVVVGKTDEAEVIANVWAGSVRSVTEMRLLGGEWMTMENFAGQCPFFLRLKELEAGPNSPPGMRLPGAATTRHLWRAKLPAGLRRGTHVVEVRTTDMFGQVFSRKRIFRVS